MSFIPRGSPSTMCAMLTASAVGTAGFAWSGFWTGEAFTPPTNSFKEGNSVTVLPGSQDGYRTSKGSLKPLVVCGPSGVGKGTLIDKLMGDYPEQFGFSVSHTTRNPRPGEVHGQHYYFSDKAAMQADINANKFIEHANVHGNLYGTSIAAVGEVQKKGKVCILDIDVQGVKSVRSAGPGEIDPHYLFVAPPSMELLERRLRGRGTENEEQVTKRLSNARAEVEYGTIPGNFDKVVVNDDLDEAYDNLVTTVEDWYPHLS
ncbi:unnamed protein product, partial [Choristocarpus tenellus]